MWFDIMQSSQTIKSTADLQCASLGNSHGHKEQ